MTRRKGALLPEALAESERQRQTAAWEAWARKTPSELRAGLGLRDLAYLVSVQRLKEHDHVALCEPGRPDMREGRVGVVWCTVREPETRVASRAHGGHAHAYRIVVNVCGVAVEYRRAPGYDMYMDRAGRWLEAYPRKEEG